MNRTRLSIGFLLSAIVAVLVGGIQPALAGSQSCYQPDGLIRGGPASSFIGGNIYNSTAAGQTQTRHASRGHFDEFKIQIQNDASDCSDDFFVQGDGSSSGFSVKYFYLGSDVTNGVEAGTFTTASLSIGESDFLIAQITVKNSANIGQVKTAMVTATSESDGTRTDTVAAKVIVKKKAGDANGARPV